MIRILRFYLILMLLFVAVGSVKAQNEGVPQPKQSALDLAFQQPERWTGYDYDHATTFWERSYVMTGIGTDGIWGMSELFGRSTNGFFGAIDFGHWFAPAYGYEIGLNYGLLPVLDWKVSRFGVNYSEPSCTNYVSVTGSFIFNITSYAQKRQSPARWELIAKGGLDVRIQDIVALGVNTSMRCQYNLTPELGLYLEPQLGLYTNALDNEINSPNYPIHILPSISAGLSVRLERSKGYRKKGYVEPSKRVKRYIEKHGEDRNIGERLFGRRLNADIIADTVSQAYLNKLRLDSLRADSIRNIVVIPKDSASLAKQRADSLHRVVTRIDSLKQIAIMRKSAAGRATLAADSLRKLESKRADSLKRVVREKFVADSLAKVEKELNHKYHCGKVALSTNMLYWAAAIPNIGVEVPIKNHYSVAMNYAFPWFANYPAGFSHRLLNWDLEGRYWLNGTNKLRGAYGGVFGSLGYYDFMRGEKGYQGEILFSAGVSVGYSLPLGRTVSLNMALGVGMISTTYSLYHEDESYLVYDSKHTFSSFGPTKATVGITWSPEFDFKNTALFNRSIRAENKVVRDENRVRRDSIDLRNRARAEEAKRQEEQWREEQKLAKAQAKESKAATRKEDRATAAKERETEIAKRKAEAESKKAEAEKAKKEKAPKELKEPKAPKELKEPKEPKAPKELKEPKAPKEPKEPKAPKKESKKEEDI